MAMCMLNPLPTPGGFVRILILWFNWSLFPEDDYGVRPMTKLEEGAKTDQADRLIN